MSQKSNVLISYCKYLCFQKILSLFYKADQIEAIIKIISVASNHNLILKGRISICNINSKQWSFYARCQMSPNMKSKSFIFQIFYLPKYVLFSFQTWERSNKNRAERIGRNEQHC